MQASNYYLSDGATLEANGTTYTIHEKLGSGGFGITYKANFTKEVEIKEQFQTIKTTVSIPVAIKELFIEGKCLRNTDGGTISLQSLNLMEFDTFKQKFLKEAETLCKFNQVTNVLHVIAFFEANNTAYMVMEYVEGDTLTELVKLHGKLPESLAVKYASQIARGLIEVHQARVLHRDIKPDNIIITPDNEAVLIDFGAARGFVADQSVTQSVILTHGYAPIEQYSEKRKRGPFTDIYGLGATLYFCLSGQKPPSIYDRDKEESLEVPGISTELNQVVKKATNYEGMNRYLNAGDLLAALDNIHPDSESQPVQNPNSKAYGNKTIEGEQTQIMTISQNHEETKGPEKTQMSFFDETSGNTIHYSNYEKKEFKKEIDEFIREKLDWFPEDMRPGIEPHLYSLNKQKLDEVRFYPFMNPSKYRNLSIYGGLLALDRFKLGEISNGFSKLIGVPFTLVFFGFLLTAVISGEDIERLNLSEVLTHMLLPGALLIKIIWLFHDIDKAKENASRWNQDHLLKVTPITEFFPKNKMGWYPSKKVHQLNEFLTEKINVNQQKYLIPKLVNPLNVKIAFYFFGWLGIDLILQRRWWSFGGRLLILIMAFALAIISLTDQEYYLLEPAFVFYLPMQLLGLFGIYYWPRKLNYSRTKQVEEGELPVNEP